MPSSAEVISKVKYAREAATVSLGIFLVDTFARGVINNQVTDGLTKKAEEAIPSALVAPRISDDLGLPSHSLDLAADITLASGATLIAKQTTEKPWQLAAIAAGAQVASSAVDALVTETDNLNPVERHQQDVGASAIESAFIMKFLLDKKAAAQTRRSKIGWTAAAGLFGLSVSVGASYFDRKNATLDFTSHTAGLGVGALASYLKNHREPARLDATFEHGS